MVHTHDINPAADMNPMVTVVVPCYNHAKYLAECLDSVLAQTYSNWEVIIVNDGSVDNSVEVASAYCDKDVRIRLINQPNAGPSAARNRGVSAGCGQYIAFLDADNKLAPQYLELGVDYLNTHPTCTLYHTKLNFFGSVSGVDEFTYKGYANLLCTNSIDCGCIIRKLDFESIGGFDESMLIALEDWEFFIRLLYPDKEVYCHPQPLYHYRMTDDGSNRNEKNYEEVTLVKQYIFKKHIDKYFEFWGAPQNYYQDYHFFRNMVRHPLLKVPFRILFLFNKYIKSLAVFKR